MRLLPFVMAASRPGAEGVRVNACGRGPGERTFVLRTFGCKSNQYESEGIRQALRDAGWREVDDPALAAAAVVNTCAVTSRADRTCRNAVRQLLRANPSLRLVVTGCAVDLDQAWTAELGGIACRVPNPRKHAIASWLDAARAGDGAPDSETPSDPSAGIVDEAAEDRFAFCLRRFEHRTRAYVKVQDGCAGGCAYCTVPLARGAPRSRSLDAILDECRRLLDHGHRELVCTGINIGAYRDASGRTLADVAEAVARLPGLERLRLGSVEPVHVTDRLLEAMRAIPAVCPHLHLPLQSGDDRILAAMGRRYTTADFRATVTLIRDVLDDPGLTTDVIVGFPGEDEAAFETTRRFCEEIGFSRMHVFLFSPRPGTRAAAFRRGEPQREVTRRRDRLLAMAEAQAARFARKRVGVPVRFLAESFRDGCLSGYTDRYLPARAPGTADRLGEMIHVVPSACDGPCLH